MLIVGKVPFSCHFEPMAPVIPNLGPTSESVHTVQIPICIREVHGSNLGQDTDYSKGLRGFPQSL
jgi:hypothetical protein